MRSPMGYIYIYILGGNQCKNWVLWNIPVCGAYGWLYPNLSRINFLGPSFFGVNFHSQKRAQPPGVHVHTRKKTESILGPWGQTSLDKVPVAKVLFIPLKVSNKLRSEKLHTFLWLPVSLNIFPWDNPPELLKYQRWGCINFLEGYFFRAQGHEKNPASTNPDMEYWWDLWNGNILVLMI